MLRINVKTGQCIHVGPNALHIHRVNSAFDMVTFSLVSQDHNHLIREIGRCPEHGNYQIMPDVLVKVLYVNKDVASLGFTAPRSIEIRGDWKQKSIVQLTHLTDEELISYAYTRSSLTALEKELLQRF